MSGSGVSLKHLRDLLAKHRRGQAITIYARSLRVAPGTLRSFLTDSPEKLREAGAEKDRPKAIAGRAESIGRIYGYLKAVEAEELPFSDAEAAAALGLDPTDLNVQKGLARANPADPFLALDDPTLTRIIQGEGPGRKPGRMRAGVLVWPPYCSSRDNPEASFAGRMMRRLLGSLRPREWGAPDCIAMDFEEILTPEPLKVGKVDAFFAAYDMSSRRLAGFEFIHVPGLSAPLGALLITRDGAVDDDTAGEQRPCWAHILDPGRIPGLKVYVVEGDAGELLIRGACAYGEDRIGAISPEGVKDSALLDKIARELHDAAAAFADGETRFQQHSSTKRPSCFAFVADAGMVEDVHARFLDLARSVRLALPGATLISSDDVHRPEYPIGIAVSANSKRWLEILRDAMVRELFVNSGPLTARSYAHLLKEPSSSIAVGELGDEIPGHVQAIFTEDVVNELKSVRRATQDESVTRRIDTVIEKIKAVWTPGAEAADFRSSTNIRLEKSDIILTEIARALSIDVGKLLAHHEAQADKGEES